MGLTGPRDTWSPCPSSGGARCGSERARCRRRTGRCGLGLAAHPPSPFRRWDRPICRSGKSAPSRSGRTSALQRDGIPGGIAGEGLESRTRPSPFPESQITSNSWGGTRTPDPGIMSAVSYGGHSPTQECTHTAVHQHISTKHVVISATGSAKKKTVASIQTARSVARPHAVFRLRRTLPDFVRDSQTWSDSSGHSIRLQRSKRFRPVDCASSSSQAASDTCLVACCWRVDEGTVHRGKTSAVRHGERFDV